MVTRVTFPPVQGEWVRATEYEALAAHLERMTDLATAVFAANNVSAIAGIAQLLEAVEEAPTTSLARLKAQWQAEAVKSVRSEERRVGKEWRGGWGAGQ